MEIEREFDNMVIYDAGGEGNCGPLCVAAFLAAKRNIMVTQEDVRRAVGKYLKWTEPQIKDNIDNKVWWQDVDFQTAAYVYNLRILVYDPRDTTENRITEISPVGLGTNLQTMLLYHPSDHFQLLMAADEPQPPGTTKIRVFSLSRKGTPNNVLSEDVDAQLNTQKAYSVLLLDVVKNNIQYRSVPILNDYRENLYNLQQEINEVLTSPKLEEERLKFARDAWIKLETWMLGIETVLGNSVPRFSVPKTKTSIQLRHIPKSMQKKIQEASEEYKNLTLLSARVVYTTGASSKDPTALKIDVRKSLEWLGFMSVAKNQTVYKLISAVVDPASRIETTDECWFVASPKTYALFGSRISWGYAGESAYREFREAIISQETNPPFDFKAVFAAKNIETALDNISDGIKSFMRSGEGIFTQSDGSGGYRLKTFEIQDKDVEYMEKAADQHVETLSTALSIIATSSSSTGLLRMAISYSAGAYAAVSELFMSGKLSWNSLGEKFVDSRMFKDLAGVQYYCSMWAYIRFQQDVAQNVVKFGIGRILGGQTEANLEKATTALRWAHRMGKAAQGAFNQEKFFEEGWKIVMEDVCRNAAWITYAGYIQKSLGAFIADPTAGAAVYNFADLAKNVYATKVAVESERSAEDLINLLPGVGGKASDIEPEKVELDGDPVPAGMYSFDGPKGNPAISLTDENGWRRITVNSTEGIKYIVSEPPYEVENPNYGPDNTAYATWLNGDLYQINISKAMIDIRTSSDMNKFMIRNGIGQYVGNSWYCSLDHVRKVDDVHVSADVLKRVFGHGVGWVKGEINYSEVFSNEARAKANIQYVLEGTVGKPPDEAINYIEKNIPNLSQSKECLARVLSYFMTPATK